MIRSQPEDRGGRIYGAAEAVGHLVRRTREAQRLSQQQLATLTTSRASPVSRAMISAVERGRHLPGLEVLMSLSRVLQLSPSEILERVEMSQPVAVAAEGLSSEELNSRAIESFWAGRYREAVAYGDALIQVFEREPVASPREQGARLAEIEVLRAAALRRHGASTAARASCERAIAQAEGSPGIQSQAYVVLVALLVQQGCLPLARDLADRAVDLAEQSNEPRLKGRAWIERGVVLYASGRKKDAFDAFRHALRHVRKACDFRHEIHIEGNLGSCLLDLGRPRLARRRFERAVDLSRRHGIAASEALWLIELGRVARAQGSLDEADARFVEALRIAKLGEFHLTIFRAEWQRHMVLRVRHPEDPDRHRVAFLKRLFPRLKEYQGIDEVREFRAAYGASQREERAS